jgi:ribulose-phosphate 3-epimerase
VDGYEGEPMKNKIKIIPAILTEDAPALEKMLRLAEGFTDYVQIDIMDGKFVPSKSIGWRDIVNANTNLKWEVHLMVMNPEKELDNYKKAGARRVIFHFEASPTPNNVISAAKRMGLEVGIAINPETPVSKILPLTAELDSLLFMSVHPGYYGAKYLPEVLGKIVEVRRIKPNLEIAVDGGIKETNILEVAKTGVNSICVGSALFMQPDPGASYRRLQEIVRVY